MKKYFILVLPVIVTVLLTACFEYFPYDTNDRQSNTVSISATNVYGAEAIPVAYDIFAQINLLLSTQMGLGFDFNFNQEIQGVVTEYIDGEKGWDSSIAIEMSGNRRMSADGDWIQNVMTIDVTETEIFSENVRGEFYSNESTDEFTIEITKEEVGGEITFLNVVINGEVLDEAFKSRHIGVFDRTEMSVTKDIIIDASVTEIDERIYVRLVFDGGSQKVIDFVNEITGEEVGLEYFYEGVPGLLLYENLTFTFLIDSAGNLMSTSIAGGVIVSGEYFDRWNDEYIYVTGFVSFSSTEYVNHIGNLN
jgi:hypothetical protein